MSRCNTRVGIAVAVLVVTSTASAGTPPSRIVVESKGALLTVNPSGSHLSALTKGFGDCGARWSPDGRRIAFARGGQEGDCEDSAKAAVYVMNADGRNATVVVHHAIAPAWASDGSQLAFVRAGSVYVTRLGAGTSRRIVKSRDVTSVDWSPDGSRLVFSDAGALYTVHPDGSHRAKIVTTPPLHDAGAGGDCDITLLEPAWSPDGHRVAYSEHEECPGNGGIRGAEINGIVSIKPDGSDPRLLVGPKAIAVDPYAASGGFDPAWSPDGKRIAFYYDYDPLQGLATVELASGRITMLHRGLEHYSENIGRPDWR